MKQQIKNVLMISIDNLRYDCVGYQTDKRELLKHDVLKYLETPTLDGIAEKSLCFTNCISTNTYTTSAHASIFTGLYPPRHGVRAFYDTKLNPDVLTIAEILNRNNYKTILYTDIPDLFSPLNLNRGFEFELTRNDDRLLHLLKRFGDEKVFLFCHFWDVHEPFLHNTNSFLPKINDDYLDELYEIYKKYNLLDSYKRDSSNITLWNRLFRSYLRERPKSILFPLYVKGVTKFDKGRLRHFFDNLGQTGFLNDTLTAIFSDHGEGRCLHENKEYFSHGGAVYENVIRVPLIINHSGLSAGINEKLTSITDIFPTILEILDIEIPQNLDGINILVDRRETAYAECWITTAGFEENDDGNIKTIDKIFPEFLLQHMCLRTDSQKFVMWNKGRTEELQNKDIFKLSNIEFVEKLYKYILGRFPDLEGSQSAINALKSGLKTRKEMQYDFLNSIEYKRLPKYCVYNLVKDTEEDFPIDGTNISEAMIYFNYIKKQSSYALKTEKIFNIEEINNSEKKTILPEVIEEKAFVFSPLCEKEKKSVEIIKKAFDIYGADSIAVAWTGGKDSTTVLHLIKQAFGSIPFKVINIDTNVDFPEIYEIIDYLKERWNIDLHIFKNEKASQLINISKDHAECCYQLKTLPLNEAITSLKIKVLITALRWDEQDARGEEVYFSDRETPEHVRVQPILHFREVDIWQYIKKYDIPYCELYNKGYRSLGCVPCTTISTGRHERSGRAQNKEQIMAKLRELGYF